MKLQENSQKVYDLLSPICKNIYYNPPSNIKMKYPCIVYHRDRHFSNTANNKAYITKNSYSLTIITNDPDDEIIEKVLQLPNCSYSNQSAYESLYNIYANITIL